MAKYSPKKKPSLATIQEYRIPLPKEYTLLGDQEDYEQLPPHWQEQIHFYDKTGSDFLYQYWDSSNLITGPLYQPFLGSPFTHLEQLTSWESQELAQWLYDRGLAFGQEVWLLSNFRHTAVQMTWKMVIKLREELFVGDDVVLFDNSLQWCLFYYHEEVFFWGRY